jgi:hypothetical protein
MRVVASASRAARSPRVQAIDESRPYRSRQDVGVSDDQESRRSGLGLIDAARRLGRARGNAHYQAPGIQGIGRGGPVKLLGIWHGFFRQ